MPRPKPKCANCSRPIGPGGAKGLDARCYQHQRRHGHLPPVAPLRNEIPLVRVSTQLSEEDAHRVGVASRGSGSVAAWIRLAILAALRRGLA